MWRHGNAFCTTGPLYAESTGQPRPKIQTMEFWMLSNRNKPWKELSSSRWFETPWCSCDVTVIPLKGLPTILRGDKYRAFETLQNFDSRLDGISPMCLSNSKRYKQIKPSYREISIISRSLVGNNIVDHSDAAVASPVGAVPTTSSCST